MLLILLFAFSGCRTVYNPPERLTPLPGFVPEWNSMDEGLDYFSFQNETAVLVLHALRVDLSIDVWEIVIAEPPGPGKYSVAGMRTSRFLRDQGCRAAVNGGPFYPYRWFFSRIGQTPVGLFVLDGKVVEEPREDFAALVIDGSGGLSVRMQSEYPFDARAALGGFQLLLENGEIVPLPGGPLDARTAAGLSEDSRYLYLMAVDGRRHNYSWGLTLHETAGYLRCLGAREGLNMDGGGSTVMVVSVPDNEGAARVVNRPANSRGLPERITATHLGIRKKTGVLVND